MGNSLETNSYINLKAFTNARIALGNTAGRLLLPDVLNLQLAHALAKDALQIKLDTEAFEQKSKNFNFPFYIVESQASTFDLYLKRPDLGRKLSEQSIETLRESTAHKTDILLIISDGLSAGAVNTYAFLVLEQFVQQINTIYNLAIVLVKRGRVAISDQIGELFNAKLAVIMLGERPGLSNPESLGVYLTYKPKVGNTDDQRNCISNIQANGLTVNQAVQQLLYLCNEALAHQYSGVNLKLTLDFPAKELQTNNG